jgi:hypothetical protein
MGGRLELRVEFPGRAPVVLEGLGDADDALPTRNFERRAV